MFQWIQNLFSGSTDANQLQTLDTDSVDQYNVFRGYFENIELEDNRLVIDGWMLSHQGSYDAYVLYINGVRRATAKIVARPDVATALPDILNVENCGFHFEAPLNEKDAQSPIHLCVRGSVLQTEPGRMETAYWLDMNERLKAPPKHLIERVDGTGIAPFFLLKGAQNYWELIKAIEKHRTLNSIDTMLDWGCGSGRLIGFFAEYSDIPNIYGCDIDSEAVAWCHSNFSKQKFAKIPLMPPTKYAEDKFDLVVSFSVLTHLEREAQAAWLKEMERILKPGGLLLATVHGFTAAKAMLGVETAYQVKRDGIHDELKDSALKGVAPDGYYRTVFVTPEYVKKTWTETFNVVDYIEQGASNYHDLVVMKKRNKDGAAPSKKSGFNNY
ncbi:MAG: class I SAM-dependent methyltransferase [Candidatus Hinthialibacter antarcticus]|nr:class I SAM-dependent methyltransferase [Candidatus Hinthialibacter antarcticus]